MQEEIGSALGSKVKLTESSSVAENIENKSRSDCGRWLSD